MNIEELKALAEKAPKGRWDVGSYYIWRGDDKWHPIHVQKRGLMAETKTAAMSEYIAGANPAAMIELIAQLEDAQSESRALLATEQNLRERVKELEAQAENPYKDADDFLTIAYLHGFEKGKDAARALLEQQK